MFFILSILKVARPSSWRLLVIAVTFLAVSAIISIFVEAPTAQRRFVLDAIARGTASGEPGDIAVTGVILGFAAVTFFEFLKAYRCIAEHAKAGTIPQILRLEDPKRVWPWLVVCALMPFAYVVYLMGSVSQSISPALGIFGFFAHFLIVSFVLLFLCGDLLLMALYRRLRMQRA